MARDAAGEVTAELAADPAAAWNQRDMQVLVSLFHGDAACINVAGAHLRARGEIDQAHAAVYAGPSRNSALTAGQKPPVPGALT